MNDTVKGITPEDDREHIISLYGHVKGVEREIELIKTNPVSYTHLTLPTIYSV